MTVVLAECGFCVRSDATVFTDWSHVRSEWVIIVVRVGRVPLQLGPKAAETSSVLPFCLFYYIVLLRWTARSCHRVAHPAAE